MFGAGLFGMVGTAIALFLIALLVACCSHFVSLGGLGSVGEEFSWSRVWKHTWSIGKLAVPFGFVVGALTSVYGWAAIVLAATGLLLVYLAWLWVTSWRAQTL